MKRLLIKLWLVAVITSAISFIAIEIISTHVRSDEELDDELDVFAPGYLIAAKSVSKTHGAARAQKLAELCDIFDYPVVVASPAEVPSDVPFQFDDGMPIAYVGLEKYAAPIPNEDNYLVFGPLPPLPTRHIPIRIFILAIAAVAFGLIFWLTLRSLGRAHIDLENAAQKMADGDFSVRVEKQANAPSLVNAFNRMAGETDNLIKSQQSLLRGVSHELRTPISRLRIGVHLMAQTDDAKQRTSRAADLDNDLSDMDELIESLLTNARLDVASEPSRAQINVEQTINSFVKHESNETDIDVIVKCADVTISADPRLFKWAIRNLVRNALRHAQETVTIHARSDKTNDYLTVEDDGPGIPAEKRDQVLKPFVRLEQESRPGYGIGLSLVRDILLKHDGTLTIAGSPDGKSRGCTVVTMWPRKSE